MMNKSFYLNVSINEFPSVMEISVPQHSISGYVLTNKYRPNIFIPDTHLPIQEMQAGELFEEFKNDCQNIISYAEQSPKSGVNALADGVLYVVRDHVQRCGRLIFGDLLIYIDCFAYLLKASCTTSESDMCPSYTIQLAIAVKMFLPYLKDDATLMPFENGWAYNRLKNYANDLTMKIHGIEIL